MLHFSRECDLCSPRFFGRQSRQGHAFIFRLAPVGLHSVSIVLGAGRYAQISPLIIETVVILMVCLYLAVSRSKDETVHVPYLGSCVERAPVSVRFDAPRASSKHTFKIFVIHKGDEAP